MMPIGPLMIEHRLIERMISLIKKEGAKINQLKKADIFFLDTAIDFFRTYADRCHHGKEEDILFKSLTHKKLAGDHARIMKELIQEHVYARQMVAKLVKARQDYAAGQGRALEDIAGSILALVEFYPKHIEKEDKHFFIPCMIYFSKTELNVMLKEFWEFDKNLIHEKYQKVVEGFEKK